MEDKRKVSDNFRHNKSNFAGGSIAQDDACTEEMYLHGNFVLRWPGKLIISTVSPIKCVIHDRQA